MLTSATPHLLLAPQTHNSNWTSIFWDEPAGLALIRLRYPWYLSAYQSFKLPVERSDALKPLVLHAFGGVYLDSDIECTRCEGAPPGASGCDNWMGPHMRAQLQDSATAWLSGPQTAPPPTMPPACDAGHTSSTQPGTAHNRPVDAAHPLHRPFDASLAGASLVLESQPTQVNTGQYASAAGHPFLLAHMAFLISQARAGRFNAITTTGPMGLTASFQRVLGVSPQQRYAEFNYSASKLHAQAVAEMAALNISVADLSGPPDGGGQLVVRVYPIGQWLEPCIWSDAACMEKLAQGKPLSTVRRGVVGEHHFSGTWLTGGGHKGRARHLARVATDGIARWFTQQSDFMAMPGCGRSGFCAINASAAVAEANCTGTGGTWLRAGRHAWCKEAAAGGAAMRGAKGCATLAIVADARAEEAKRTIAALLQLPCELTVVAAQPAEQKEADSIAAWLKTARPANGSAPGATPGVQWHTIALAALDDWLADTPEASLELVTRLATRNGALALEAVYIDAGEAAWAALAAEYATAAASLRGAGALLLALPAPPAARRHVLYYAFHHLVQEMGFLGVLHNSVGGGTGWPVAVTLQPLTLTAD